MTLRENVYHFYKQKWSTLLDPANYPPEIRVHLQQEAQLFQTIVREHSYEAIVEVGCANGQFLMNIAIELGLHYIGIDFVSEACDRALEKIRELQPSDISMATVVCGDICNPSTLTMCRPFLEGLKTLVTFPFNSFGNISAPLYVVRTIAYHRYDLLIFTYSTGDNATRARARYYGNCGLEGLICEENELGVLFRSLDSFHSYAYHSQVVSNWLWQSGYQVTQVPYGPIGIAYHARLPE